MSLQSPQLAHLAFQTLLFSLALVVRTQCGVAVALTPAPPATSVNPWSCNAVAALPKLLNGAMLQVQLQTPNSFYDEVYIKTHSQTKCMT